MITEPPNQSMEKRIEFAQFLFEEYEIRSLYFANQTTLSLYASARTTGTVIDCGHSLTYCVPIYEGYAIPHAIIKMPLAGRELSNFMFEML